MEIVIGDGSIFIAPSKIKYSNYPCLILLRGESGEIDRPSEIWTEGREIRPDDPDIILKIIFTNYKSLSVFKRQVNKL